MAKMTITQAKSFQELLNNLVDYEQKGYGSITNLICMTNPSYKTSIFLRYEKTFVLSPSPSVDFSIVEVKKDGQIEEISDFFKNIKERYAFLGECIAFNKDEIEIIE